MIYQEPDHSFICGIVVGLCLAILVALPACQAYAKLECLPTPTNESKEAK